MIYAYIRVSTDRQTVENQRFEILKYCAGKKIHVDDWIEEVVSGTKRLKTAARSGFEKFGKKNDILIVSELSHLG